MFLVVCVDMGMRKRWGDGVYKKRVVIWLDVVILFLFCIIVVVFDVFFFN